MPHTRATLRALQEKFDRELLTASTDEERYTNREALKQQIQRLVATEGQVYLPALPRAVQDFLGTCMPCVCALSCDFCCPPLFLHLLLINLSNLFSFLFFS
jgi:hypothetical protein